MSADDRDADVLAHTCDDTRLYVLQDVTVWVRVYKDGRIGNMRDSRQHIQEEAKSQIHRGDDVVCAGCGFTGRLP